MLTPYECGQVSEMVITIDCETCQVTTPEEIRKAGEMLISKMARCIEKYNDLNTAIEVLNRTLLHIQKPKGMPHETN